MEGQIDGDQGMIRIDSLPDEREGGGCFTIAVKGKQDPGSRSPNKIMELGGLVRNKMPGRHKWLFYEDFLGKYGKNVVDLFSCLTNRMPNNQFKKGELYSFITGKASTAIARNLQKKFGAAGLKITIEQWSVLYHLWKEDGKSQQELCVATFRDKPSITRLVDNLEKQQLVKRVPAENDRRINLIYLTKQAQKLQEETMALAESTLNAALDGVAPERIEICKEVLQVVYDNLR